jgi:hypothetical protein
VYRLHIDIPLDHDLETAKKIGKDVINGIVKNRAESVSEIFIADAAPHLFKVQQPNTTHNVNQINYRLGADTDRQRSNYYIMDSKGHVTHKKCVINLCKGEVSQPRMD